MNKSNFKLIIGVGAVAAAVTLTATTANAGKTEGLMKRSHMNSEIVTGSIQPKTPVPTKKVRTKHQ
jgi:hypothetical protein